MNNDAIGWLVQPEYERLFQVYIDALQQAQDGKGKERHGEPVAFEQQCGCRNARNFGIGFALGQAVKKAEETMRLPTTERKLAEIYGAMNYLAMAAIILKEQQQ